MKDRIKQFMLDKGMTQKALAAELCISEATLTGIFTGRTRPTVNNGTNVTVEAWLLDFDGDLYGQNVRVEFHHRIRDEVRFDSLDALKAQIQSDADATRAYFAK